MKLFAIGDLHLSFDETVNKPMDIFGNAWQDYTDRLKENWLSVVSPEDTVIIPGDLSWGLKLEEALADLAWVDALPGHKVIVRGNHDLWWSSMAKMRKLYQSVSFIQNDAYDGGAFVIMGSRGWLCPGDSGFSENDDRKIYEREILRLEMSAAAAAQLMEKSRAEGRTPVLFGAMHYPPTNEKKQPSGFTDIFAKAGCRTVVYGHLHGEHAFYNGPYGLTDGTEYKLCSLDRLDCMPALIYDTDAAYE